MAEQDVNYATVVFKPKKAPPRKVKKEEETVYDEVKGQSRTEPTADTNVSAGFWPDKNSNNRHQQNQQLTCCLGILCVILLLGVIAMSIYFTLTDDRTTLMSDIHNLTNITNKLLSDNDDLRKNYQNLTQKFTVLESNITNLTEENKQLKTQNQNLTTQKQELVKERTNLTEQIQNMETKWNQLNVSRPQWTIDNYCPKDQTGGRQCKACPTGWINFSSSCYAVNNVNSPNGRTWEGAREDCRGKKSDLAVIDNQEEKTFITNNSWKESGISGYWIGLRAETGTWKWTDGSFLTESSWIQESPTNNSCVTSLQGQGWNSVSCDDRHAWICEKQGLSV